LSKSLDSWINSAIGTLSAQLPSELKSYVDQDLPDHPVGLMESSFGDELFSSSSFRGVLSLLRPNMASLYNETFSGYQKLEPNQSYLLPPIAGHNAKKLQASLNRVNRAICFAEWRTSHYDDCLKIYHQIIGAKLKPSDNIDQMDLSIAPIRNRLIMLQSVTTSAEPISECIAKVKQLISIVKGRRKSEVQCQDYDNAVTALESIKRLGSLAAQQVNDLQDDLQGATERWRDSLYRNAYSKSGHALAKTAVAPEGELSISVGSHNTIAPAQHVSNASALRASLLGFYFAFWERVLKTRGGFKLMILDDPQEMLDEENEARLACTIALLAKGKAQLLVTTHDQKFAGLVSREGQAAAVIEHRSIHPVNSCRHTIETPLAYQDLIKKRLAFINDRDNMPAARDYLAECRVYIEARLTDFFDDPAYASKTLKPTLSDHIGHARHLLKNHSNNELFKADSFRQLCRDPSLAQGSACLTRLNDSHHGGKRDIMASDVCDIEADLERLVKLADALHTDFRLWRRRDDLITPVVPNKNVRINAIATPIIKPLPIYQDLAAFTGSAPSFNQEVFEENTIDGEWFSDKALFFLRNDMLGYSAPAGSVAIVEASGAHIDDQSLVIAKYKNKYLARRLLRNNKHSTDITLATVTTDPRMRPPTIVVSTLDVELYRIVGFLFDEMPPSDINNKHDAIPVENASVFKKIKSCYQVNGISAEPLALDGQLVLGGDALSREGFSSKHNSFVAMSLSGGGGVFKRLGDSLPGNLKHLIQLDSIGGRGSSIVVSTSEQSIDSQNVRSIISGRSIVGVIYEL